MKKLKKSNCDNSKTQIVTKLTRSNCDKTQFMTNLLKSLLVRTTWHLNNGWDVLWAAFCDSRNVFFFITFFVITTSLLSLLSLLLYCHYCHYWRYCHYSHYCPYYPILDTKISVCSDFVRPFVTLRVAPLYFATGLTGELWSKTKLL